MMFIKYLSVFFLVISCGVERLNFRSAKQDVVTDKSDAFHLQSEETIGPVTASDYAEEHAVNGQMSLSSSDLEFGRADGWQGQAEQISGLLFNNIVIPAGASITEAFIEFTADESNSGSISIDIFAELNVDPDQFSSASSNISGRSKTEGKVTWTPGAWSTSQVYKSPDLSVLVQELVNQEGWQAGNPMAFILQRTALGPTSRRVAETTPTLVISYSLEDSNQSPEPGPQNLDVTLEAESGILNKVVAASNFSGASGGRFADFQGTNASVKWNEQLPAGTYEVRVRYGGGRTRAATLIVNNQFKFDLELRENSERNWAQWETEVLEITVNEPIQSLEVNSEDKSTGPNLDNIRVISKSISAPAPQEECTDTLQGGEGLGVGEYICNGSYSFGLQQVNSNKFLVILNEQSVVKSLQINDDAKTLEMQSDGNLVVYNDCASPRWASATHRDNRGAHLEIRGDGNVMVMNNGQIKFNFAESDGTGPINRDPSCDGNNPGDNPPNQGDGFAHSHSGGGEIKDTSGYFTWNNLRVDYTSKGALKNGGILNRSSDAEAGDYEIVAFGASHGGGNEWKDEYFDESLMLGQGFIGLGVKGEKDKKVAMWVRKNSGQSQIRVPDRVRAYAFLFLSGEGLNINLNQLSANTVRSSGTTYTVPAGGSGLNILSYFSDDPVELKNYGSGALLYQEWGFGDADGFHMILYRPGTQLPSSMPVTNYDPVGKQYVGITGNFKRQ